MKLGELQVLLCKSPTVLGETVVPAVRACGLTLLGAGEKVSAIPDGGSLT